MRALLFLFLAAGLSGQEAATLAIRGGHIWTGDARKPWAQAVAISGNRVLAVGGNKDIARVITPKTQILEAGGRFIMPGFEDAHIHFASGSLGLFDVDLTGARTLQEVQQRIAAWARENPDAPWVEGGGWEYYVFPGGRLPTRQDLDAVVSDRPALLRAYDGHTTWVNSKALELAKITKDTRFDGFGELVKDPKTGEPTGCLKERAASLVSRLLPATTRERRLEALERGLQLAASLGITSIQNASGMRRDISLYEEFLKAGKLTLRTDISMSMGSDPDACAKLADLRGKYTGPFLRVAMVKFVIDGVIESHTAAMLAPYADGSNTVGQLAWQPDAYKRAVKACADAGWQVETHAIGDRAVRLALDAYSALPRDARPRVEHIETIQPEDLRRFGKQRVIASMMPIHADPETVDVWSRAIGAQRLPNSFAWNSLQRAGARLAFSSDWPASPSLDPIRGIHNAVNRRTITGKPAGGWLPEQRVTLESALRAYTTDAAYAAFEEKDRGQIAPGMLADIVILSQDLFRIAPMDIYKTMVDVTVFDGRVVYRRMQHEEITATSQPR